MENINVNDKVRYIGKPNTWTFSEDLNENSKGIVLGIIFSNEELHYQVKFENGIIASIDGEDLVVEL